MTWTSKMLFVYVNRAGRSLLHLHLISFYEPKIFIIKKLIAFGANPSFVDMQSFDLMN